MESWVKVGAKCVLVDDKFESDDLTIDYYEIFPVKGKIYTIREIIDIDIGFGVSIRLKEIVNDEFLYKENGAFVITELSFFVRRFRPLIKKTMTQDISMFKKFITKKVLDELV